MNKTQINYEIAIDRFAQAHTNQSDSITACRQAGKKAITYMTTNQINFYTYENR